MIEANQNIIADFSNFSGVLHAGQILTLKANMVNEAIVGTQTSVQGENFTQQQSDILNSSGIPVVANYEELYWDFVDSDRVRHACTFQSRDNEVYLAVENSEKYPFPPNLGDLLYMHCLEVQNAGKVPGIYTSKKYWDETGLGNDRRFAGMPLWDANYSGPDATWVPFGPWLQYKYRQFSDKGLPGINCDLSQQWGVAPTPIPPPPVPTPTPVPVPEGDEMFVPFSKEDGFYSIPANQRFNTTIFPNAVGGFQTPDGVDIEVEICLNSGSSAVNVKHGDSPDDNSINGYAFRVPATSLLMHGRVRPSANATFMIQPQGNASIRWLRCLGYYAPASTNLPSVQEA